MDVLPTFKLNRPKELAEVMQLLTDAPDSRPLGGGTDLLVNVRRGLGDERAMIDMTGVADLKEIAVDGNRLRVGASVTIADLAAHADVQTRFPVIAEAAASIAGPTHRAMGTVGGNICLDTRCKFYNQSEWWRGANDYCLKYEGVKCHVAPKSKVCFATFSGDLAPAFLVLGGQVEIADPGGQRTMPLGELYTGDGQHFLTLKPGEIVTAVTAEAPDGLVSAYDKIRVRQSIDYPLAGIAVALRMDGRDIADLRVAITGTNPQPVLLDGVEEIFGGPLSDDALGILDDLARDQIMAMKTTVTPGHYRRRAALAIAKRMVKKLASG